MRKYIGLIILFISSVALGLLTNSGILATTYSECMSDMATYEQLINNRELYEGLVTGLFFDEQELFYDDNTKTFYYSLVEGSSSAYNPQVKVKSDVEEVTILVLEGITKGDIEKNKTYSVLAYTSKYYYLYKLKCTTLPLMNVNVEAAISKTAVPMTMTLFDNRKGAVNRVTDSDGTIRVRGASTAKLEKTSYKLSLTSESLGENTRPNHVSLLGMRKDDDWLLYAPYNDLEKVRNVFNSNLWTETCGINNENGIQTGIEYKFFEMFINGKYMGLYALGYPVDEKLMGVAEEEGEALYKKVYWGTKFDFSYLMNTRNEIFVNGYDAKTVNENEKNDIYAKWRMLLEYYQKVYQSKYDNEALLELIDIDNAIDTYLFFNMIQGRDNVSGGLIKNMYMYIQKDGENLKMIYAPWDMDLTWGNDYVDNIEENFVAPYRFTAEDNLCMLFGPLNQLLINKEPLVFEKIFERYWELRAEGWSDEHINVLLDSYEADIYGSGAYRRENERWPQGTQADPEDGLDVFRNYVMERIHIVDEYYQKLEADYKSGTFEIELSSEFDFSASPIGCPDLKLYLTLLAFAEYDVSVEVRDSEIWEDTYYAALFEQAGVEAESAVLNPELEAEVHMILLDYETKEIVDDTYFMLEE